ncbi:MAG: replication factor C large subunit [Candidatus Micrarchaeota archaeon]
MLLTEKYRPKKIDDLIGNDEARSKIKQWILNWIKGNKRKPLLVYGPPGTGKTTIPYALKNEFELDIVEMSGNTLRDKKRIDKILGGATLAMSIFEKMTIILIDDIDILTRNDRGAIGEITKYLKDKRKPILLTAGDAWNKKLAPIRTECELIQMKRINKSSIAKLLTQIAKQEKIDEECIPEIAENCNGDVRSAINDLHARHSGLRDVNQDIFQRVRDIFKASNYKEAKKAVSGDIDYNLIKLWIDENIPNEYSDKADLANAYNYLSRADIFEGRIKNSTWGYLKYVIDLSTIGVSLAKKEVYRKFTKYEFPKYLKYMSQSIQRRALLKAIGTKIGKVTHTNRKDALNYLPLIQELGKSKENQDGLMNLYLFEEEELAFILETSVSRIKKTLD